MTKKNRESFNFINISSQAKQLEERLQRHIIKSRPYFEEKLLCQEQLNTQKERVESIKKEINKAKQAYAQTLKRLEQISNEIHMKRKGLTTDSDIFNRPREPGVGAELSPVDADPKHNNPLPDFNLELDRCEIRSAGSVSGTCSSAVSERDEDEAFDEDVIDELKQKFKELAVRPVNGGEGKSTDGVWESELRNAVDKLDHVMMMQECAKELDNFKSEVCGGGKEEKGVCEQ